MDLVVEPHNNNNNNNHNNNDNNDNNDYYNDCFDSRIARVA